MTPLVVPTSPAPSPRDDPSWAGDVLSHLPAPVLVVGVDGVVLEANQAMADLVAAPHGADLVGCRALELVHPVDAGEVRSAFDRLDAGRDRLVHDCRLLGRDGRCPSVRVHGRVVRAGGSAAVVALHVEDMTARNALEAQLEHRALHDELTGLPNRALLADELRRHLARARREGRTVAALFVDVDRFKALNDTLGHATGDVVLCAVAARLRAALRPSDVLARLGGDEFVAVCTVDRPEAVTAIAHRALELLSEPVVVGPAPITVSASIGVALSDPARSVDDAAETLLREADVAMYAAKATGRARVEHVGAARTIPAVQLVAAGLGGLPDAVVEHDHDVVRRTMRWLATGAPFGEQLLLRWVCPAEGTTLGDAAFAARLSHLAVERLGQLTLAALVARVDGPGAATPEGVGARLWVRLPVERARDPLTGTAVAVAQQLGPLATRIGFELPERALLAEPRAEGAALVATLRDLGAAVAIDDAGAGYSSLAYLRHLPIDVVHIDRHLVAGLDQPGGSRSTHAAAAGLVALGHAIGATVVGQGIETQAQLDALRSVGCDVGRGSVFDRPVVVPPAA